MDRAGDGSRERWPRCTRAWQGVVGETYNIGCEEECTNLEIAEKLVQAVKPGANPKENIVFVADRPFNDVRYYISSKKLMALGWKPEVDLEHGIKKTVEWYKNVSPDWWEIGTDSALAPHPVPKGAI